MTKGSELIPAVRELVQLVEGLDAGHLVCACRRVYRVGTTKELKAVLDKIKPMIAQEGEELLPANSRFALLEVD